ncbi:MAG TPA: hypothetical protein VNK04_17210 [Gemmataceae bacterium]|nr:hypothetical protein [Gemmataceae bacterium]
MNRPIVTLALTTLFMIAAAVPAEEPHLEFVRGLRARRLNDLALEYLQKLSKNAPPDLARELPLEFARTRLELAKEEPDIGRRLALYGEARKDLEQLLKANPAREGEARLEMAQVAVLQGKAQLSRALREESSAARRAEMIKARKLLEDAGKLLEVAAAHLDAQLAKLPEQPKTPQEQTARRTLEEARLRADLDRGLNLLDQAQTYTDEGNLKVLEQRGELVKRAEEMLRQVEEQDDNNPLCWEAAAWVGRCQYEGGNPRQARIRFENIIKETNPAAESGRRLAAYFRILALPQAAVLGKENAADLQRQAAEQWLARYRTYTNTPEGQGVMFQLAELYYQQAQEAKDPANRRRLYEQARELYRQLEQTDNDYTDRARDRKVRITFLAQGGPSGDVTKFTTFEDCYVRAQYEAFKLNEDPKEIKDAKELEKKRKERFATIITALDRALKLTAAGRGGKVSERDLLVATGMLAYACLASGDYARAVQVGESLAYTKPQSSQAAAAAIYALQAYAQLLADPAKAEDYRAGMVQLVNYVKQRWPTEPVADFARHQLGLLLIREKKFPEAVAELATVSPRYANLIPVKWQLASAAFQAEQDRSEPVGPDKRPFKEQGLAALRSMPELPDDADPLTAQIYVAAKIQLGQHLYEMKQFQEMEELAGPLLQRLPQLRLENETVREQLRTGLAALILYARYGRAEADYDAGRYAEARKALDPVIDEAKAGKLPELKAVPQLRWALLGLALRANVQDGNLKRAQDVLQALQKYADDQEGQGKIEAILQPVIKVMSDQVEELRRAGEAEELDRTVQRFADFLDALRKQQKKPTSELLFVLGQSYTSLGKYAEALAVLEQIKPPADGDEQANRVYRAARLLQVRARRLSGQLDQAESALKAVLAEPWGKQNLEALKEEAHLLDARQKYGAAAVQWNTLLKTLQGKIQTDAAAKEQFFEIYFYLTRSYYRYGMSQSDKAKGEKYVKASAGFIAKLESSWPDLGGETSKARFTELLEKEPALKKAYEQAKAENR